MAADVLLWSNSPGVRRAVKDGVAPLKVSARGCGPRNVPHRADAVVTTGALSAATERLAARLGTALVYVLPEAADALADLVTSLEEPVLAGSDLASMDRLSAADLNVGKQAEITL